jgi:hypothetical protein
MSSSRAARYAITSFILSNHILPAQASLLMEVLYNSDHHKTFYLQQSNSWHITNIFVTVIEDDFVVWSPDSDILPAPISDLLRSVNNV